MWQVYKTIRDNDFCLNSLPSPGFSELNSILFANHTLHLTMNIWKAPIKGRKWQRKMRQKGKKKNIINNQLRKVGHLRKSPAKSLETTRPTPWNRFMTLEMTTWKLLNFLQKLAHLKVLVFKWLPLYPICLQLTVLHNVLVHVCLFSLGSSQFSLAQLNIHEIIFKRL